MLRVLWGRSTGVGRYEECDCDVEWLRWMIGEADDAAVDIAMKISSLGGEDGGQSRSHFIYDT